MYDDASDLEAYLATFPALVRVIPVAKAMRSPAGLGLYLESAAVYTTGIAIRYSQVSVDIADAMKAAPSEPTAMEHMLQMTGQWTISDDAQTPYVGHGMGSGGGGGRMMTMNVSFEPAPLPAATQLTVEYQGQLVTVDLASGVESH